MSVNRQTPRPLLTTPGITPRLHKNHVEDGYKPKNSVSRLFEIHVSRNHPELDLESCLFLRVFYPPGKPRIPHLLRYQGFAVNYYSFTLDALDLRHPQLLQR